MTRTGMQGRIAPLALLLASAMALAQPLQPKTENGVSYLCGGVGLDESNYLKQEAAKGGLLLTFAARDGSFLAGVHVEIEDVQGKPVLQTDCDGPMMLVSVSGKESYKVKADYRGKTLIRSVAPGGKEAGRAVFVWPAGNNGNDGGNETGNSSGASAGETEGK